MHPDLVPVGVRSKARFAEYCNLPTKPMDGHEGEVTSKNLRLLSVHVIMRHGDHDVDYDILKAVNPKLHCDMDATLIRSHPAIAAYVEQMTRYRRLGDAKKALFPKDDMYPHRHLCNGSHLTGVGALQALVLGDYLRHRYTNPGRIWSGVRLMRDDILIRCTKHLRTYHNAMAFAYSFLPHLNPTKIDCHMSIKSFCDVQKSGLMCHCKAANIFLREDRMFSVGHHMQDLTFQKTLVKLAEIYNDTKLLKVEHPWPFLDTMMTLLCHNVSNTCNARGKCITYKLIQKLWDNLDNAQSYWDNPSHSMQKSRILFGLPLMTEIAKRLINHSEVGADKSVNGTFSVNETLMSSKLPKFILYSGQGDSVSNTLEVLGAFTQKWPPYASRVILESYEHKQLNIQLLRVIYNGKEITSDMPFCRNKTLVYETHTFCPLKLFVQYILHGVYQEFNGLSYPAACKLKTSLSM